MIINHDGKQMAPKKSEDEQKEEMLAELRQESASVISLALIYAKGFKATGEDLTTVWRSAEEKAEILLRKYSEGYKAGLIDGVAQGKEIEREEIIQDLIRRRV